MLNRGEEIEISNAIKQSLPNAPQQEMQLIRKAIIAALKKYDELRDERDGKTTD